MLRTIAVIQLGIEEQGSQRHPPDQCDKVVLSALVLHDPSCHDLPARTQAVVRDAHRPALAPLSPHERSSPAGGIADGPLRRTEVAGRVVSRAPAGCPRASL